MRKSFLNKIVIIGGIALMFGCKARKEAVSNPASSKETVSSAKPVSATETVLKNISTGQFDFKTLSLKARAELSIGNNNNDVGMNIRIRKDETIWVSITAIAGLEVARALITPDSIKVMNRLEGIYTAKPFSYIYQYANRQIDFKALQALLVGNAIPGTVSDRSDAEILGNQVRLSGNLSGILYKLTFNPDNKLVENKLKDSATGKELLAGYSNFQVIAGMKVPSNVRLSSAAQNKSVLIELKYNSVSMNEAVEFPFSVPKRFQVN